MKAKKTDLTEWWEKALQLTKKVVKHSLRTIKLILTSYLKKFNFSGGVGEICDLKIVAAPTLHDTMQKAQDRGSMLFCMKDKVQIQ